MREKPEKGLIFKRLSFNSPIFDGVLFL